MSEPQEFMAYWTLLQAADAIRDLRECGADVSSVEIVCLRLRDGRKVFRLLFAPEKVSQ